MELIRSIVKVGNSAGVILPKEWLNGKAKVELIAKPLNIKKEIFEILEEYLPEIEGMYIVGSYARNDETKKSDVDILAISTKTNKKITSGKYNIILISKDNLEQALQSNIFPLLPMIKEASPLLNKRLLEEYSNKELTSKNLRWHIETTKSILNVSKEKIKIDKERGKTDDSVSYSLILRLREVYILDCLINSRMWSNSGLLGLIKKVSGSTNAYDGYLRVKNNTAQKKQLPIEEAENILDYIHSKIIEQEKWLQKRK